VWCLTAIGGVGKHIVDREDSTNGNVRVPGVIVTARNITTVTTIDETQSKRRCPLRANCMGITHALVHHFC